MHTLIAAPLGVAAALASAAADAAVQAEQEPEALVTPAQMLPAEPRPSAPPAPALFARELPEVASDRAAAAPAQPCDEKCKFVELTAAVLPNTMVADLVSLALEPDKHALNIPSDDGTAAVTIQLDPTKIAYGKGLVATAKF